MATRHDAEIGGYILDGMARALWVHAYMIWATEVEPPPVMGESWEEMAPNNANTRRASTQAAKALTELIARAIPGHTHPLAYLFERGVAASGGRRTRGATPADLAYAYGDSLALVCLGSVDPSDSVLPLPADFRPPQFHVALEDDGRELTWDGGLSLEGTQNPRRVRPPTVDEIAQAFAYIKREFQPAPTISADRWIEGLAFGEHASVDSADLFQAQSALSQLDADTWRILAARADDARSHEGMAPRFVDRGQRNPAATGPTVLILEDDPQLQKAIGRWIKKIFGTSTHIVISDNVDAAIANLGVHQVKLIVSDVDVLGDKSGVDLFEWVRAHQPELVDRYIFFTGGHPEVAQLHYRYLAKGEASFEDFKSEYRKPAPGHASQAAPVIARTVTPPRAARGTAAPMSLEEFAAAVHGAMPQIPEEWTAARQFRGRVGAQKVFISALWRVLEHDPRFRGMTLDQFKRRLIEANREQLVSLVRADSQGDMDPAEAETSEIRDMGSEFHLVIDPSTTRRAPRPANASDADLRQFATQVQAELPYIVVEQGEGGRAKGRFGRKVFIAALWRRLRTAPSFHGMPFSDFKRKLVEAHRAGLLVLARADLVGAMDPQEVADSETDVRAASGSTMAQFHFVVDE